MTFKDLVNEELGVDLDAIKAQIKQLQTYISEKDQEISTKDKTIQELQNKLKQTMSRNTIKIPDKKIGVGTSKTISPVVSGNNKEAQGIS